jgi:hydroxymethylpyrimidine pyrophosphatase-like HAD family hydrolase
MPAQDTKGSQPLNEGSFQALACDYDGTIARDGAVAPATVEALRSLRGSDRKLLLVTGRRLDDLLCIFNHIELFERIVAENGAVLFRPGTGEFVDLSAPPPPSFIELLREREVQPLEIGRVIVATREPQEVPVLEAIRILGLELQVIFNKGAVMVLPSGINKATGLKRALKELRIAPKSVVAVGDAENDHAFFEFCGFSVAVANALPAVQEHADFTTTAPNGAGVVELIRALMEGRLQPKRRGDRAAA